MRDPLIAYLKNPNQSKFEALVEETNKKVVDAAYRVTRDPSLAHDVAQEVFLKVLESPWSPDEVTSGTGLLVHTATLKARTAVRAEVRRRRWQTEAGQCRQDAAERSGEDLLELAEVEQAIHALPSELKECVEYRYYQDCSVSEIAAAVGKSKRTVKYRLHEARAQLEKRLSASAFVFVAPSLNPDGTGSALHCPVGFDAEALRDAIANHFGPKPLTGAHLRPLRVVIAILLPLGLLCGVLIFRTITQSSPSNLTNTDTAKASEEPARSRAPEPRVVKPTAKMAATPTAESHRSTLRINAADPQGIPVREGTLWFMAPDRGGFISGELYQWVAKNLELEPIETPAVTVHRQTPSVPLAALPLAWEIPDELLGTQFVIHMELEDERVPDRSTGTFRPVTHELSKTSTSIELLVEDPWKLPLVVVDRKTKSPIAGASIRSISELSHRYGRDQLVLRKYGWTETDSLGYGLVTGLREGKHDFYVSAWGYEALKLVEIECEEDLELTTAGQILLQPIEEHGTLRVRVHGDGELISNQRVFLARLIPDRRLPVQNSVFSESDVQEGLTSASGEVEFRNVPVGEYRVQVYWEGHSHEFRDYCRARHLSWDEARTWATRDLASAPEEPVDVELGFVHRAATLAVEVKSHDGKPLPNVTVVLGGARKETDRFGRTNLEHLDVGDHTIEVVCYQSKAGLSRAVTLEDGDNNLQVLFGAHFLRNRIVDPMGLPLPGLRVTAADENQSFAGYSDDNGIATVAGLTPGDYLVSILHPGFKYCGRQIEVTIPSRDSKPWVLQPAGILHVEVSLESKGSYSKSDLSIDAIGPGGEPLPSPLVLGEEPTTKRKRHDFVWPAAPLGDVTLMLKYGRKEHSRVVHVTIGTEESNEIRFPDL